MKVVRPILIGVSMLIFSQLSAQKNEKKIQNKFNRINKDGNEFISKEEWKDFYIEKKTKKGKPFNFKRVFLGYDRNDDNKISLTEMKKGFDKELAKKKIKALKKSNKF